MNNDFTKWFLICVTRKYAAFNGRARRKEYWMFTLICCILVFIPFFIEAFLGIFPVLSNIILLALIIPSVAVCVRRLHDVGKSGWWYFVNLIPIIGPLYFLYLMIKDGQPDANQWGLNPKNQNAL
jgi:uncharacterized membrane protein YhaH (DUF805 family)